MIQVLHVLKRVPLLYFRCAASLSQAMRQVGASRHKHTLPDLAYDYGALEPHISAEIMQLHHSKHHATYVNNLNVTEEKYQEALAKSMDAIMNCGCHDGGHTI